MSTHHHHHHRRVVDYCPENDDDDDDDAKEVEFSIEEELKELSALIETSLADAFGFACADDLEASAKTDGDDDEATKRLSADLRLILTPLSSSSQKEEQKRACERCVSTLWRILREQSCGWDKPCYRECFVLSSLRLSVCELSGKKENEADDAKDSQKAMECLDTALILGCPGGMARPFVRCVEKFMRRTEKKRASGDDDDGSDNNNNNSKKQKVSQEALVVENVLPSSVPKIIHPLERMNDDATWEEFKAMYFNKDLPVQLPSDKSMPCIERWRDVAYFKERFGKRLIPLEVGKYDDVENWKEEIISMEKFIDEHLAPDILKKEGNTFVSYLAQHQLFEQIPQLAMDFEIPKWCNAGRFERCNIWLGTSGTITPCHFDSYDNIFGQVVGYKFVRLFLESDSPFLYQSGGQWETTRSWNVNDDDNEENDENTKKRESKKKFRNAQGNISRVDVESPDLEKYPEFAKATPMDVVLGPGDFIYIPSRTWHYVRSLTASCSLNFLF